MWWKRNFKFFTLVNNKSCCLFYFSNAFYQVCKIKGLLKFLSICTPKWIQKPNIGKDACALEGCDVLVESTTWFAILM